MGLTRQIGTLFLVGMLAPPVFAESATITAQSPETMAETMRNLGYRAELAKDGEGDPLIRSAASGLKFGIYFYGCEAGVNCTTVQFYLGLTLDDDVPANRLNEWNRTMRFGTAVLDTDGQPYLKMELNLDYGGITSIAFEDNLELWERLMADFSRHLNFDGEAPELKSAPDTGPTQDL